MNTLDSSIASKISEIIFYEIDVDNQPTFNSDPFWLNLRQTGTELWLDTGDMDEAAKIWTSEMTALTTNNTLLNNEIQKGIYDDFVKQVNAELDGLTLHERILEIAFILNARHGLKLIEKFGGKVSVELHTDLAHDLEGIVNYGKRFHDISPEGFIIKVPYTSTGLLGARRLREMNIPINFTLEFSARQNALVAAIVKPDYLNIFLGRLNAFVADNNLGDGEMVGEKTTIASQRIVHELTENNKVSTRQIAASLRSGKQLELLAGIDVFTMPTNVAKDGLQTLSGEFESKTDEDYQVTLFNSVDPEAVKIEKLWEVSEAERNLAQTLDKETPASGKELEEAAHEMGCGDMFPRLSEKDMANITFDGKIPRFDRWSERIKNGEVAIDTLLNLAGLASFTKDQEALDNRIKGLIS